MKMANALSLNPDYLLVGEPTGGEIATLQKGIHSYSVISD
jgi:ABC-type glutathione transport system ATPase component